MRSAAAQKYRLYLKRVQGVQPGSRGNSGATPSMHLGPDAGLFSHGLGGVDQVRGNRSFVSIASSVLLIPKMAEWQAVSRA